MQKNYELLYIVHPDLEGSTEKITEKVAGFITKPGGTVTSSEDWGKRKLAYKIAKNDFGVYVLVNFSLESTMLFEVERDLRLAEEIMRSMIVIIPELTPAQLAKKKPRLKKEEMEAKAAKAAKKDEPANIIVADDSKKEKAKTAEVEKVAVEVTTDAEVAEPKKAAAKKPAVKIATKKEVETDEKVEKARLKKLDEKLDELLK